MKKEQYRNTIRVLAGAVLSSSRSDRDLLEIIETLEADPALALELAALLRGFLELRASPSNKVENFQNEMNPIANIAYDLVQRRQISKAHLIEITHRLNPNFKLLSPQKASVRRILDSFLEQSGTSSGSKLMEMLGLDVGSDPYLRGIDSRK